MQTNTKDKKLFSYFLINLAIIISSTLGVAWAFFADAHTPLNYNTFLYFTTQSNIFVLVIASIFAIKQFKQLKGKQQNYSNTLMIIKYIATVAITITLLVYTGLLLPEIIVKGEIHKLFTINNFTLHYITPILAIVTFFVYDKNYAPKIKHSFLTALAPLAYFIFAIILSFIPGDGFFGSAVAKSKFPYFFLNYQTNGWFSLSGGIFKLGVFWWVLILFALISALSYGYISLFNKIHKKENPTQNKEALQENLQETAQETLQETLQLEKKPSEETQPENT